MYIFVQTARNNRATKSARFLHDFERKLVLKGVPRTTYETFLEWDPVMYILTG